MEHGLATSNRGAACGDSDSSHGFFDGIGGPIPAFKLEFLSASETLEKDNRYKVELKVTIPELAYKIVFDRLKAGSIAGSDDELSMITTVYVLDKGIFKKCIEWKQWDTERQWKDHYGSS